MFHQPLDFEKLVNQFSERIIKASFNIFLPRQITLARPMIRKESISIWRIISTIGLMLKFVDVQPFCMVTSKLLWYLI